MMLLMHLSLLALLDFADLSLGMLMLHLFTFDPAWVRPRPAAGPGLLFYDGGCGLCHRAVRFVLAEDRDGTAFRFAPLDSENFRSVVPEATRKRLPDSFVVLTADGVVLTRSTAVRYLLARLGGFWRLLGGVAALVPARLLDAAYDGVAAIRGRLLAQPAGACPVLAAKLRERFVTTVTKSVP
jgi:predicted DCC family thiol-disulfide oxidoreductase YuxK